MVTRATTVEVEGRTLRLTNLDKVLYPDCGFTKADVLDYYRRVAPALLAHLDRRPVTFLRAPDGVEGERFYEKRRPGGAPSWIGTIGVPGRHPSVEAPAVDSLPALLWAANRAVLELHVPQWRVGADGSAAPPDLLVLDLDPGPPATLVECCAVGLLLRAVLRADGLEPLAKVSGAKGLQLYARRSPVCGEEPSTYARRLAEGLAAARPDLVVSSMRRSLRRDRVLLDWSQNHPAKTTIAPYSLRARRLPTVSCPVTWDEVEATADDGDPSSLRFLPSQVVGRLESHGDLFAPLLGTRRLPGDEEGVAR